MSIKRFELKKEKLTLLQIFQIKMHIETAVGYSHEDKWIIVDNGTTIKAISDTSAFDMQTFLEKIRVPKDAYLSRVF